jgi:hypothetical protein
MRKTIIICSSKRLCFGLATVFLLAAFAGITDFSKQDFEKLKPLSGLWITKRTNGDIYERWERTGQSEFTGKSYKIVKADTVKLETMRLYRTGNEIIFAPVTAGQNDEKEVLFKLKSIQGNKFVFENLQHDFPQRIVYHIKSQDSLDAYIEGQIEAKNKRIDYPYSRIH